MFLVTFRGKHVLSFLLLGGKLGSHAASHTENLWAQGWCDYIRHLVLRLRGGEYRRRCSDEEAGYRFGLERTLRCHGGHVTRRHFSSSISHASSILS